MDQSDHVTKVLYEKLFVIKYKISVEYCRVQKNFFLGDRPRQEILKLHLEQKTKFKANYQH